MLVAMTSQPIAPQLFESLPVPHLIGGRHRQSGRVVFPLDTTDDQFEACTLPNRGTLWSYTVQRFRPKTPPYLGPEQFEPFALGYVELPGAVIVESRLTDVPFEKLRIGMPMALTIIPLMTNADGTQITTYAFRPA
jgi:uncharacterized OB-fold protein